jgi:hypothetical protein
MDAVSVEEILESGSLDMVKNIYESGKLFSTYPHMVCYLASKNYSVDILKFVHEKGFSLSSSCIVNAITNGNLPMLIYLHQHGCPSDFTECLVDCELGDETQIKLCCQYAVTHYGRCYYTHNEWHVLSTSRNE